jgi:hypothetical protein
MIVLNFFKEVVVPFVRRSGITRSKRTVLNWDLHSSHCNEELLTFLEAENIGIGYFPGHATHYLQFQDQDEFQDLKTESRKDIDMWTVYLAQRTQKLKIEDFPYVVQRAVAVLCLPCRQDQPLLRRHRKRRPWPTAA